jgi:hypothetical protein
MAFEIDILAPSSQNRSTMNPQLCAWNPLDPVIGYLSIVIICYQNISKHIKSYPYSGFRRPGGYV